MADVEVTTAFNIPHAQDTDDSSDEDAVNTATSRVYMGPLQSPEKKLASNAGLPTPRRSTRASTSSNQSPLRRSSRLSNARTPDQVAEEDHESDSEDDGVVEPAVEDSTGEGTPEKDVLVDDEPPSVLALRISRAHDNPSPPPRMADLEPEDSSPDDAPQKTSEKLIDISQSFDGGLLFQQLQPPAAPTEDPCSPFSPPPSHVDNDFQTPDNEADEVSRDLIAFDQSPLPAVVSESSLPQPIASVTDGSNILDVIDLSPERPPTHGEAATNGDIAMDGVDPDSLTTAEEESHKEVKIVLLTDHGAGNDDPTPTIQAVSSGESLPERLAEATPPPEAQKATPRRRSARLSHSKGNSGTTSPERRRSVSPRLKSPELTSSRKQLSPLSPESASLLSNLLAPLVQPESSTSSGPLLPESFFVDKAPPPRPRSPKRQPSSDAVHTIQDTIRPPIFGTPRRATSGDPGSSGSQPVTETVPSPMRISSPARRVPIHPTAARPGRVPGTGGVFGAPVFTAPPLEGQSRSPARRVPVKDLPPSATKLSRFGSTEPSGSNVDSTFTHTRPLDDPNRTPARRVKAADFNSTVTSSRPLSPLKAPRFGSVEPQTSSISRIKPPSRSLSDSEAPSPSKPRAALPFPLRAGGIHRVTPALPRAIPEEDEGPASSTEAPPSTARPPPSQSPAKSNLRQPTVTSKIPRIGVKPYAKHPDAKQPSAKPVAPRKAVGKPAVKSLNLTRPSTSGASGSGDLPPRSVPSAPRPTTSATTEVKDSSASSLKRKRVESTLPATQIRTNLPPRRAMGAPKIREKTPSPLEASTSTRARDEGSPKRPRVARKVEAPARRPQTVVAQGPTATFGIVPEPVKSRTPSPPNFPSATAKDPSTPPADTTRSPSPIEITSSPIAEEPPILSPPLKETESTNTSGPPGVRFEGPAASPSSSASTSSTRRSTRSTVVNQSTSHDVIGQTRPLQPRRKQQRQAVLDPTGFSAMSAVALKNLTANNTTKNQYYITARLETEIVRKDGDRPSSPTTKVRTLLDKQKEDKMKEREERAARRRARRAVVSTDDEDDQTDLGDLSFASIDIGPDGQPLKHRLGAGDEEEWETPEKGDDVVKARRVKWDKLLFDTVYFEDINPPNPPEGASKLTPKQKGALAPTAKGLRLDQFGNVLTAENPLEGIAVEDIVIQKFIFDNDPEAQEIPKPKPKGKGKKAKN